MATTCDNCGESCGPDDLFCESCGYDFVTGSVPESSDLPPLVNVPGDAAAVSATNTATGATDTTDSAGVTTESTPVPSLVDDPSGGIPRVLITVSTDADYFAAMVTEGEVPLPDPMPPDQELELFGTELHIGRTSESRAVHPNIDVEALTGDPAVSTRHAVLRISNNGTMTITDVGSTNGTFVGGFDGEPITQGVPVELGDEKVAYVGAWTRLAIQPG